MSKPIGGAVPPHLLRQLRSAAAYDGSLCTALQLWVDHGTDQARDHVIQQLGIAHARYHTPPTRQDTP